MKTTMKKLAALTIMAIIVIAGSVQAKGTELSALSHESIESSLEIENWMVNENIWETNSKSAFFLEQDFEESMEIENWMTNENTWELSIDLTEEKEPAMKVESWMLNEENWK